MYKASAGDTFERIARQQYGTERYASLLRRANPGVEEPIQEGTVVATPTQPGAPVDTPVAASTVSQNEVSIVMGGAQWDTWTKVSIVRGVDVVDSISVTAPMDTGSAVFRDVVKPLSFAEIVVSVGGARVFTGTQIGTTPSLGPSSKTVEISGYSRPGVLNDCTPPSSAKELQYSGQNILEIASDICEPFGIGAVIEGDPGPVFDRVACDPSQKILGFLADLAVQRNYTLSSSPEGSLRIWRSVKNVAPVANLTQGEAPLLSVELQEDPQAYYSSVTGTEPAIVGLRGGSYTVQNPFAGTAIRPYTYTVTDAIGGDVKTAVESKAARMFGSAISYVVTLATWRDNAGALFKPNTLVVLAAPDAMVYKETTFLVKQVELRRSASKETAVLSLVLPGAFSGELPEALPWD